MPAFSSRLTPLAAACGLLLAAQAHAGSISFTCLSGNWSNGSCWTSGQLPVSYSNSPNGPVGDDVIVGPLANVPVTLGFTSGDAAYIRNLSVYGFVGAVTGPSVLVQDGGVLQTLGSVQVDGIYQLSGGALTVWGSFRQSDFARDTQGTLTVGAHGSRDPARFELTGGALTSTSQIIGYVGELSGEFIQSGGSNTVRNRLNVGFNEYLDNYGITLHGSGSYTLTGGSVDAGAILVTGSSQAYLRSSFTQTGGAVTSVGDITLSYGDWNIKGGSISARALTVGIDGDANFVQSGGSVSLGSVSVAYNRGDTGSYTLSGAGVSLSTQVSVVGGSGTGLFTQAGGTHATGLLWVGSSASQGWRSSGTYLLQGGTLSATNETIGRDGVGVFRQSGGDNSLTGTLTMGVSGGFFVGQPGDGKYYLSAGTLQAQSEIIGVDGNATFTQSGGSNTTGSLTIGKNGVYTMSGGSLSVTSALTNNGSFTVTGGSFSTTADIVNNGTWQVKGASLHFAATTEYGANSRSNLELGAEATYAGMVYERTGAIFTGGGTKIFAGGLSIGNSPGTVTESGNVTFLASNSYLAEIGGLVAGTGYDHYRVNGELALGGALVITAWNGYAAQLGQVYDLFDWGSVSGQFSSIDYSGLGLANGLALDVSRLYLDGTVAVVPEPGTYAMLLAGLGLLGWQRARRRS